MGLGFGTSTKILYFRRQLKIPSLDEDLRLNISKGKIWTRFQSFIGWIIKHPDWPQHLNLSAGILIMILKWTPLGEAVRWWLMLSIFPVSSTGLEQRHLWWRPADGESQTGTGLLDWRWPGGHAYQTANPGVFYWSKTFHRSRVILNLIIWFQLG